jgi:hypothetical protein
MYVCVEVMMVFANHPILAEMRRGRGGEAPPLCGQWCDERVCSRALYDRAMHSQGHTHQTRHFPAKSS